MNPRAVHLLRPVLALCLVATMLTSAAAQSTRPTLKIAWTPADTAAEAIYASELGYFSAAGFDVDLTAMQNGPAVAAAVASGAIDIGISNLLTLSVGHEKGLPFTMVAAGGLAIAGPHPTTGLLAVTAASPFHTAKDLEGKTIAVDGLGSISAPGVRNWLDVNGGDSKTVHFIEVPFSAMPAALQAGRIDAAVLVWENDPTMGKPGDPLRLLAAVFNSVAPRLVFTAWFSTNDWVAKHPDLARKFAGVMKRTARWANAHHAESAAILAKYDGQTPAQINALPRVEYGTELIPNQVQPSIDLSARYGVIRSSFPAKDIIAPLAP